MSDIIQFDWRTHWKTKVKPHLKKEAVQVSLDLGMGLFEPRWERGDPPYILGGIDGRRVVKGDLSWYQPLHRCHYISFFSMAIGVINYPELQWKMLHGDHHTVPVGYGADGAPRVVMDILLFHSMTAEESIAYATRTSGEPDDELALAFRFMEEMLVPLIRTHCT